MKRKTIVKRWRVVAYWACQPTKLNFRPMGEYRFQFVARFVAWLCSSEHLICEVHEIMESWRAEDQSEI